jgi:predicted DNA-binding WGR domain protein
MRIFLQQKPAAGEAPRYFQLMLQQDLLGGWTLVRESGQLGGKVQLKREVFLEQAQAVSAFEKARDLQIKRGFQIMFAEGAAKPGLGIGDS